MQASCNPGRLCPISPPVKREVPPNHVDIDSAGGTRAQVAYRAFSARLRFEESCSSTLEAISILAHGAHHTRPRYCSVGELLGRPASLHILELSKVTFLTFLPVPARQFD